MADTKAETALALARSIQAVADQLGAGEGDAKPPPPSRLDDPLGLYDAVIDNDELRVTTRRLFEQQNYTLAVEEAFKCLNNLVKRRVSSAADGSGLMKEALSLNKPLLKLSELKTKSQQDQQLGYMEILSGAMTGIRNPRAHEHGYLDEPNVALEMLALANHLMRMIDGAKRARPRKNS